MPISEFVGGTCENFGKMAEIAITAALSIMANHIPHLIQVLKDHQNVQDGVDKIQIWLRRILAYLSDTDADDASEQIKEGVMIARGLANQIEDVLDELMFLTDGKSSSISKVFNTVKGRTPFHPLNDIPYKIASITKKMDSLTDFNQALPINIDYVTGRGGGGRYQRSTSGTMLDDHEFSRVTDKEEIVGFEGYKVKLISHSINGHPSTTTLAVVGPCGAGKTLLVKHVYKDKRLQRHFDRLAWIQVSCISDSAKIPCYIITQLLVKSRKGALTSTNISELANQINQHRKDRWFIVLDNFWTIGHHQLISSALSNGSRKSGSIIVIITRNTDLAKQFVHSDEYIHKLGELALFDAWKLFCKKAFSGGKCPSELEEWAQKIVTKCGGLPFAIVQAGCLLSKKEQRPLEWKKVHDRLGVDSSPLSITRRILLPCFKDLPANLRACFMYFSNFPEDYSIEKERLIRLWVAEGYAAGTHPNQTTAEDEANDCLKELIERNLVKTSKLDFDGQVKFCRIDNLVHDFLRSRSRDENFASVIGEPTSSNNSATSVVPRRLSVHPHSGIPIQWEHLKDDLSTVRAAFLFDTHKRISQSELVNNLISKFRLMKILDLRDAPLDKFPKQILKLSLLKYLCLRRTDIENIPKSIHKLSCLETLDLKQTHVKSLPKNIIKLLHLRHLLVYRYNVNGYVSFDSVQGVELKDLGSMSIRIHKLSMVKADNNGNTVKELGALSQLRKLGLLNLRAKDGNCLCISIQKMVKLSTLDLSSTTKDEHLDLDSMQNPPPHLQRLYLKGKIEKIPIWISKLNDLLRIHLKWSGMSNDPLPILEELPNLMELHLAEAYTGDKLVFRGGKFKKLKVLHIEQLNRLDKMILEKGVMPELKKLTICGCSNLKVFPLGINYLTHLEETEMLGMPNEFMACMKENGGKSWEFSKLMFR